MKWQKTLSVMTVMRTVVIFATFRVLPAIAL